MAFVAATPILDEVKVNGLVQKTRIIAEAEVKMLTTGKPYRDICIPQTGQSITAFCSARAYAIAAKGG
jgi:hypothetical protein